MEAKDVKIGKVYDIKVGKNTTPVRIMKLAAEGGWEAVSLSTEKQIIIKSPERFLGLYSPKAGKAKQPDTTPAEEQSPNTAKPEATGGKRLSALDAAVKVLTEAEGPLNCKQMIDTMITKGYWAPSHSGKTPANTLHAAIGAEIKKKGDQARFEKMGRGQFALRATS